MSATVEIRTPDGSTSGSVELPDEVFDVQANIALMHQVVVGQLAAARQGTHATKTRGMVAGGGTKPYRQKGTGRARQGSIRAPQFTGGGTVHGPQPRNYEQRTPKKMKAAALRGALSDRARGGRVHVVSAFLDGDTPSTKTAAATLKGVVESKRILVVVERSDEITWKSLRNLPAVHLIAPDQLNTYDVLVSDDVVFTEGALTAFLGGAPKGRSATASARESEAATESTVDGPHGAGSHAATEDGEQPEGFPIKGNADSNLYHLPGSRYYDQTEAEVWFATEDDAKAAGFTKAGARKKAAPDAEEADQ